MWSSCTRARRLRHSASGSGASAGGFASEIEPEEGGGGGALQHRGSAEYYGAEGGGGGIEAPALIPAVRRSGGPARPPRYPTGAAPGKEQQHPGQHGAAGKQHPGAPAHASPKPPSPTSLHQQHQLAYQQQSPPSRSAFLSSHQQPRGVPAGQHARGYAAPRQERALGARTVPGSMSAGAVSPTAATVTALRSATAAASRREQGLRQLDVESGKDQRASYSFAPQPQMPSREAAAPLAHSADPSSYAPSSYAASDGIPSSGSRRTRRAACSAPPPWRRCHRPAPPAAC